jgi:hypothetical protein
MPIKLVDAEEALYDLLAELRLGGREIVKLDPDVDKVIERRVQELRENKTALVGLQVKRTMDLVRKGFTIVGPSYCTRLQHRAKKVIVDHKGVVYGSV